MFRNKQTLEAQSWARGWDWGEILNKFQLFWSSFLYFNNKKPFGSAVWYPGLDLGTEQGQ